MKAAALSGILRQIGLTFIIGLFLQVRVDDRLVLLPIAAAAMVWQLRRLQTFASSPEAQRAWRGAIGSAALAVPLGLVGLIPPVEPGLVSVLSSILLLFGTISYCSLLAHWARRTAWSDAAVAFDRARLWTVTNLGVVGVGVAALLLLGRRSIAGEEGDIVPGVVLGRVFGGALVVAVLLVVTGLWIGAMVSLQMANRKVRAGLRAQPDARVPLA